MCAIPAPMFFLIFFLVLVFVRTARAGLGPLPTMQGSTTGPCLRLGRSTPSMGAIFRSIPLALLVTRLLLADDANHAPAAHHLALVADLLDARTDLADS